MVTNKLAEPKLDWLVARIEGDELPKAGGKGLDYSSDWAHGGPIIEREGITVSKEDGGWSAYFRDNLFNDDGSEHWQTGPTALIAGLRCYVASKLGDTAEVPEELL